MKLTLGRGSHYQSPSVYKLFTALKLGQQCDLRYRLAAKHIEPGGSVLDVCAGLGEFQRFLPQDCSYCAVEASRPFARVLTKKGVPHLSLNLHAEPQKVPSADHITMIISLYQFRETTADRLLEEFKTKARKVIIVEETASQSRSPIVDRLADYFCAVDYSRPARLFSPEEFSAIMGRHGFEVLSYNERYQIGIYEAAKG